MSRGCFILFSSRRVEPFPPRQPQMCGSKMGCGILVSETRLLSHWCTFDGTGKASQMVAKRAAADSCLTCFYSEVPISFLIALFSSSNCLQEDGSTSKCQIPLRPGAVGSSFSRLTCVLDEFFFGESGMEFCLVGVGRPPAGVVLSFVPLGIRTAKVDQGQHLAIVHKVRPDIQVDETHVRWQFCFFSNTMFWFLFVVSLAQLASYSCSKICSSRAFYVAPPRIIPRANKTVFVTFRSGAGAGWVLPSIHWLPLRCDRFAGVRRSVEVRVRVPFSGF